jgi:hypothetical protein
MSYLKDFNNNNKKFNILEKKLSQEFNISKHTLFELINKNQDFSHNFFGLISSTFLCLLSVIGIIITKLKQIKKSHYFIIPLYSGFPYKDNRSSQIFLKLPTSKTLNIVKCYSIKRALFFFFNNPSTIFFNSFLSIIFFFYYKFSTNIFINYNNYHKCYFIYSKIIKKILDFLKINKFYSIDDYRNSCFFQKICKDKNIISIGYMHGRFHKHQYGILYDVFDYYLVWDIFFKKKILKLNNKYKSNQILFIKNPNLKKRIKRKDKNELTKNIIYIYEENINYKNILNFLNMINNSININLEIKLRENSVLNKKFLHFCNKNKIKLIYENDFSEVVKHKKYEILLAHNSTLLYEASYFNILPIRIYNKKINQTNYIDDSIFISLKDLKSNKLHEILNVSKKKEVIKKLNTILWKYHLTKFPKKNNYMIKKIFS